MEGSDGGGGPRLLKSRTLGIPAGIREESDDRRFRSDFRTYRSREPAGSLEPFCAHGELTGADRTRSARAVPALTPARPERFVAAVLSCEKPLVPPLALGQAITPGT